jgi:hypothetical protein
MHSKSSRPESVEALSWVLVGAPTTEAALAPLIEAHRRRQPVRVLRTTAELSDELDDAAAVLICGDPHDSPQIAAPGIFVNAPNGRRVPCGWLPAVESRLTRYAQGAAEVLVREDCGAVVGPVALLGEFDQRALDTVADVQDVIPDNFPVSRWTAERIRGKALTAALGAGPALAMYFGHGDANGWVGYGGFDRTDLAVFTGSPIGAVISLTCATASRPREGLSFCEELVLSGVCAAAIGAVARTSHRQNVALGVELARALGSNPCVTVADLLVAAIIPNAALRHYRIVGDPLAPLIGATDSVEKCRQVFAPNPDASLPLIPLSEWYKETR